MINQDRIKKPSVVARAFALGCGLVICVIGCVKPVGDDSNSEGPTDASQVQLKRDSVTSISPQLLTGVWLGQASLDREKLQQKIAGLSPPQQQVVAAKATSFLTTVMAMDFRSDGTVENEIEIVSIDGQSLRDGSIGQWKVVESTTDGLMVETAEKLANGSIVTDKMFYRFFDDGNQVAISARVSEDLEGCDTMIVFERRTLLPTNVATGVSATQTK